MLLGDTFRFTARGGAIVMVSLAGGNKLCQTAAKPRISAPVRAVA
jgi:hypothetical protein